jgi:DNA-binding transcriptional ArsR family regulator
MAGEPVSCCRSGTVRADGCAGSRPGRPSGRRPRGCRAAGWVKIESMIAEQTSDLARRAAIHAALADPARLQVANTLLAGDASPSELAAMLAMPSNLLAHHLHALEQARVITRRRSEGDRRRTYLQLVPATLDSLAVPPGRATRRVLFVCTANSALAPGHGAVAAGQRRPGRIGRHPPRRADRSRRDRRRPPPPLAAAPGAAPPHRPGPRRGGPGGHRLRYGPRGTRRGRGGALVRARPGPGRRPGQLRRGPL